MPAGSSPGPSRLDTPLQSPTVLLAAGGVLSFVNLACMGLGADIWGAGTLVTGLLLALLILPVFCYRHYVQDKGRFPEAMLSDLYIQADAGQKRAGWLPYATLIAGVLVVAGCAINWCANATLQVGGSSAR